MPNIVVASIINTIQSISPNWGWDCRRGLSLIDPGKSITENSKFLLFFGIFGLNFNYFSIVTVIIIIITKMIKNFNKNKLIPKQKEIVLHSLS